MPSEEADGKVLNYRDMQIKNHEITLTTKPIRMAKITKTNTTKYWWGWKTTGILICCWWENKMVQSFQENFLHSVLVIYITYDPVIPGKMKTNTHKMTCTKMFIATSFISKNWKWPRYPPTGEWINNGFCVQWNAAQQ